MIRAALASLVLAILAGNSPPPILELKVQALRNHRGILHFCATRDAAHFPDCSADPRALKQSVPANTASVRFAGFAPGHYAVSVFHDENGNGRLDTVLRVPREGFGFSRNPVVRFGAPRFSQVGIDLGSGYARQSLRMQYLL